MRKKVCVQQQSYSSEEGNSAAFSSSPPLQRRGISGVSSINTCFSASGNQIIPGFSRRKTPASAALLLAVSKKGGQQADAA